MEDVTRSFRRRRTKKRLILAAGVAAVISLLVFGPIPGTGWVIGWSLAVVVFNLVLTCWLANRALHPLVSRLLAYFDFRLPRTAAGAAIDPGSPRTISAQ